MAENDQSTVEELEETPAEEAAPEMDDSDKVSYSLESVEDVPGSRKRLNFKVEWSDYQDQTKVFYKDLQENANIDGFRKGKAPLPIVRSRYGKEVRKQAISFIFDSCTQQIVDEQKFHVYRRLDDVAPEIKDNQALAFATTVEVKPEIEPKDYDSFEVEVESKDVQDELIDQQLEQIRKQNGNLVEKDEGAVVEKTDSVTLTTTVTGDDGNPIDHMCWFDRQVPSLEHLPEQVSEALLGKKKGEKVNVDVEMKQGEHSHKQKWEIDVKEVKTLELPELDDEFAQDVGDFKTLDELKDRIRKDMENSKEQHEKKQAIDQINDLLIERNEFDVPDYLVDMVQYQMINEDIQRMRQMGISLADLGQNEDEYRGHTRVNSEKLVRINLLLEAIGNKEDIQVSDEDVDKKIEQMAEEAGRKPLAIRANLEAQGRWDSFRDNLKSESIADYLVGKATIKTVEPKDPALEEEPTVEQ